MTARSLLLSFLSIFAVVPAKAAVRSVMENLLASNTSFILITATQRVGIATAAPQVTLDVNGVHLNRGNLIAIGSVTISAADQNNDRLRFQNVGSGSDWSWVGGIPALSNFGMCLYDNNASACRIRLLDTSGNFGIGMNNPVTLLDVGGASQFGSTAKSTFSIVGGLFIASGSSITQSGAAGFFTNTSSVNASAFFGDGSHLTGVTSVQFLSTMTFLGVDQAINATPGVCLATATRTDWNGGHITVNFAGGSITNSTVNDKSKLSILVDGAFPTEINFPSPTNALAGGDATGNIMSASFSHFVPAAISAGTHSVCLVAWREAATAGTLLCSTAISAHAPCTLQVVEMK